MTPLLAPVKIVVIVIWKKSVSAFRIHAWLLQPRLTHEFQLCTKEGHKSHCEKLNGSSHKHYSKVYGVNEKSILLDVKEYTILNWGPHDYMHDLFEGVVQYEIKLLLHCCKEKFPLWVYSISGWYPCKWFDQYCICRPTPTWTSKCMCIHMCYFDCHLIFKFWLHSLCMIVEAVVYDVWSWPILMVFQFDLFFFQFVSIWPLW